MALSKGFPAGAAKSTSGKRETHAGKDGRTYM